MNGIQFFEITSAVKGYGKKMVKAVVTAIPDDWKAAVVMDWSHLLSDQARCSWFIKNSPQ